MNYLGKHINPFEMGTGSLKFLNWTVFIPVLFILCLFALFMAKTGVIGVALCFTIVVTLIVVYAIFSRPRLGMFILIILGFIVNGLTRYVQAPVGLSIDVLIILLYLALFFKAFRYKVSWEKIKSPLTVVVTLWFGYIVLQLANPEAQSIEAWFYAMRGFAMYQFMLIPLALVVFSGPRDLSQFLIVWGILSVLGTFKGIMQFKFGVDPFEQQWLDAGSDKTHMLFGKLRVFSFYSDAGQFGAAQAHAGVVFGILALIKRVNLKLRIFFATVALMGFFGMILSGTRGAIAVPAMGGFMFLVLSKNIKVLALGLLLGLGIYVFLAHTTIGQSNYEIRRMRTAFDPNDASLRVRLENQIRLKSYLASRPFGGGVGSTGNWGRRFTPHTFLANTATDSWYVMIWADTGIIGVIYYLTMILYILIVASYNVMVRIKDTEHKVLIMALTCGFAGVILASYGNGIIGQMPTGIIMYLSMVFMFASPNWGLENGKRSLLTNPL